MASLRNDKAGKYGRRGGAYPGVLLQGSSLLSQSDKNPLGSPIENIYAGYVVRWRSKMVTMPA
jgi:hypothetical protein